MSLTITTDPQASVTVEIPRSVAERLLRRQEEWPNVEEGLVKMIETAAKGFVLAAPTVEERLEAWRRLTADLAVSGVIVDDSREAIYADEERD